MGQKVHPKGLRIGISKDWDTKWYADKRNFSDLLVEDVKIRAYVKKALYTSGVSRIEIERIVTGKTQRVKVTVNTAKPGMVIGRQGAGIADLQTQLESLTGKSVNVNVVEVKNPEVDATLVAESIAQQLEKRVSFRRAMKQSVQRAMRQGAKGVRVKISGRIGGAEIARTESDKDGTVPLHTLRADIDYGTAEANTTAGKVGVKVWLFAGDAVNHAPRGNDRDERRGGRGRGGERGGRGGDRGPRSAAGGPTPRKGGRVDAGA